jgi:hypothetical protein
MCGAAPASLRSSLPLAGIVVATDVIGRGGLAQIALERPQVE